ncbi:MAG: hypothetical protein JRE40_12165 [Deltaproteobacteria bacterium]|nr:hypothetical protein [Deltaproteobacteria bacterium]
MVSASEKGRQFENYVKRKLVGKGYLVTRSAGSKGVFDLVAIPPLSEQVGILGIQCKASRKITKHEKEKVIDAAKKYGLIPVLATKFNRRVILINLETEQLLEGL